jgi:predicted RNase H-like nuclease
MCPTLRDNAMIVVMTSSCLPAVAGADGCRNGWVVASRSGIEVVATLRHNAERIDVLGVDMPVGVAEDWYRSADAAARARLPAARRSSVFATLPRPLLAETSYAAANAESRRRFGRGLSRQSWGLVAKIREVDELVRAHPRAELVEIHPECSFLAMAGTLLPPKRTPAGVAARRAQVRRWYAGPVPERLRADGGIVATADDVLDALAVLWSVERHVAGVAEVLGDGAVDVHGTVMRIVV